MFHGFTGYKEGVELVDLADRLAKKGIVSVRFTASGFGDSEGDIEHDYRFTHYRKDAEAVYAYVSHLPYVDAGRMGVYGHSLGGRLAVLFCSNHDDIQALCIASAPVNFFDTLYGQFREEWKKTGYLEKVSSRGNTTIRLPYSYATDVDLPEHNVLEAAKKITRPHSFVIAGNIDQEVAWTETKKVFDALKSPKEFLLIDDLDHKYGRTPKIFPTVHGPIVQFFQKYL